MTGATYSNEHYTHYNTNGNKNYFEEIIDMMILQAVAGFNESFRRAVQSLPKEKQRMAILSKLDKDRNLFLSIKGLMDENVNKFNHIKDVSLMLREYVKVGEVEKKKFGEVMTPLELVKEMLSKLPEEVWKNPNLKWLDPANGTGPFPTMVIYKLMEGLREWEPDDEKRYKHIVENMIYVCELQPKNMFLWLCAVDPWDKYKLNIYCGSFLDEGFDKHMKEVWGVDKFDVVMGNPPYQDNTSTNGKTAATLWPRFIQKSVENLLTTDGFLVFVTPISWMSPGKQLIRNRVMPIYFKCNEFVYLNMDCEKYFNVGSYFSYYLLRIKNRYDEKAIVKTSTMVQTKRGSIEFDFSDLDFIPKPDSIETLSIVNKVFSKKDKISLRCSSLTRSDKPWVQKTKDDDHTYVIRHTNTEFLYSSVKPDSYGVKKVILNSTGNFNPTYDDGERGTSQITRWIQVESEEQGKLLIKYLNSKIIQFVLSSCRWSGAASKIVFEKIPQITFDRNWDDEELFKYFDITEVEKKFILNG